VELVQKVENIHGQHQRITCNTVSHSRKEMPSNFRHKHLWRHYVQSTRKRRGWMVEGHMRNICLFQLYISHMERYFKEAGKAVKPVLIKDSDTH
jgi:hypothetical protein